METDKIRRIIKAGQRSDFENKKPGRVQSTCAPRYLHFYDRLDDFIFVMKAVFNCVNAV